MGFRATAQPDVRRAAQTAIFHVQRNLEDVQGITYPSRVLLCDRGTVDEAAYWPGDPEECGNPTRIESGAQAVALHHRLHALWSQHPRFTFVAHEPSFLRKITSGLAALADILERRANDVRSPGEP